MPSGNESVIRHPAGVAPLADKVRQIHPQRFLGDGVGRIVGQEMHAGTIASVLSTTSCPGGGEKKAAVIGKRQRTRRRGERPEMAGDQLVFAGLHRLIVRLASAGRPSRIPARVANTARQHVQHRIDHAGLVTVDEGIGDVDIFGNDHARRNILSC